jgi:Tol biopolymer transport system component
MRDPMTFEARLADAFDRYVEPVDVAVDARALTASIAATQTGERSSLRSLLRQNRRAIQLALVATLLLILLFAALQAGRRPPAPPFGVAGNGSIAWGDGGDILVGDPFGSSEPRRLEATGNQVEAGFSLDGLRLVAIVERDDGRIDLQVADANGRGWRTITPEPVDEVDWVDWMPDGRTLYAAARVGDAWRLVLYDADGQVPPDWVDWPGAITDVRARPPDGRQLLVRGTTAEGTGLYLFDRGTRTFSTLVRPRVRENPDRDLVASEWSPDGSTIALQAWSDEPQLMQLFLLHTDGSPPVRLTHDERAWLESWPHWSPDGRRIAYFRLFYEATGNPSFDERALAVAWVDGHAPVVETGPVMSGDVRIASWSPDGRWLLERSNNDAQTLVDPDGGPAVRLRWASNAAASWQRVAQPGR